MAGRPTHALRRTIDARFALVLLCFLLSGFAALLYETAWARQLSFVFGTTELAVATVLAAYFGGLTFGAALAARLAPRVRRPVWTYGLLELGIAVAALAVPLGIRGARWLYVNAFAVAGTPPEAGGLPTALFYLGASFAILFVPTALMGATLPLLARYAVRRDDQLGPRVGWLYAMNTAGAVAGTVSAAFVLLPTVGLRDTILVGVATNALVFGVAAALARSEPAAPSTAPPAAPVSGPVRLILPLMLASGAASFAYEVLWTRLLGHVLGGSVYAFATMLASFLVGIALGAAAGARLATGRARAARAFGVAQLGTAGLSFAAFSAVDRLPDLAARLGAGGAALLANAAVAASVLLPAALCIGATFPLAVRVMAHSDADAGPASARVYAWNTVGAIVGSVGTGFFLLPALGFAGTLSAAVALNLGLALAACWLVPPLPRRLAVAGVAALVALALLRPGEPWNVLRTSPLGGQRVEGEAAYFAVGRNATVLLVDDGVQWLLRTNGLPEAAIRRPGTRPQSYVLTQWLATLPVLARPEARSILVVGLGAGLVVEAVPPAIERLDVVELEPEVIAANRIAADLRDVDPLADPRLRLLVNDARGALILARTHYDAIVSQPSHPWTAGASHLYTREFFSLVRERLSERGVFVQWMGLNFVDEDLLRSLVATMADVFPHVRVYLPNRGAALFIGSDAPLPVETTAERAMAEAPEAFARAGLFSTEDVAAALALDDASARLFAEGAPLIRDDLNLLQVHSPRILGRSIGGVRLDRLLEPYDPLISPTPELDRSYLIHRIVRRGSGRRALRIARATPDPVERHVGLAIARLAAGQQRQAVAELRAALRLDPESRAARYLMVRARQRALERGSPDVLALTEDAPDPDAAVFEAWRLSAGSDWRKLRELDVRLAAAHPHHHAFADAVRIRALWRIRSGDAERAREAIALIDRILPAFGRSEDHLWRAQASVLAGNPVAAVASLGEALLRLRPSDRGRRVARRARSVLATLPESDLIAQRKIQARIQALLRPRRS